MNLSLGDVCSPGSLVVLSARQRVLCPPIDFREEQVRAAASPGGATMSASFYVPRSANILRVLSAMISPDQVG